MAGPAKPPVAIRITRPYDTEDEFLAKELDTLSRAGVTLVGAQQRPDGAVLRFEIVLSTGAPLVRGEGRVVGYKQNVLGSEPGLVLRFTRLDSKSKSLIDRAAALRDQRSRPSGATAVAPAAPPPAPSSEPAVVEAAPAPEPVAAPEAAAQPEPVAEPVQDEQPTLVEQPRAPEPVRAASTPGPASLAKLRERAQALSAERVSALLDEGRERRAQLKRPT